MMFCTIPSAIAVATSTAVPSLASTITHGTTTMQANATNPTTFAERFSFATLFSSQPTINLGANAKSQAICFGFCLLAGLVSGIFALLYFRKSSVAERILTDAFATILIAGVFLLCVEFVLDGKIELYGAISYALGVCFIPFIYKRVKSRGSRSKKRTKSNTE